MSHSKPTREAFARIDRLLSQAQNELGRSVLLHGAHGPEYDLGNRLYNDLERRRRQINDLYSGRTQHARKGRASETTRRRHDFFYKQTRNAKTARELAAAEKEAEARGWEVTWEDDPEGWDSLGDIDPSTVREVLWAALRDENGEILESLGSIVDPDRSYGRLVEAELALEALTREGWKP